jgi:hypothetical protein
MDPMSLINLIFCIIIVLLGYFGFRKIGKAWPLFIAIGYGLFSLSHLLLTIGLDETWEALLIAIRILGYTALIYALYIGAFKKE